MFTQFRLGNFKSYRNAALELGPLTLLIGANASGKTNALEGIRFLSWLSQGARLEDIVTDVRDLDISIRGDLGSIGHQGVDTFSLGCSHSQSTFGEWRHFDIGFKIGERDLQITEESIRSDGEKVPLYEIKKEIKEFRYEVKVAYNNFAKGGIKPQIPCSNRRPIFSQLDAPSRFRAEESQKVIPETTIRLTESLENIIFLDPRPERMRSYSHASDTDLRHDGANLSGVLYHLCEVENRKPDVLSFVRYLPEQDIEDLQFVDTARGDVMLKLVESFGSENDEWDAAMLSDGTLRVLAVAAAVLSAPKGALIAIEEIDNGVHPSRAGQLLDGIQEVAKERDLRVLLTSHNPALLDSLPTDAVPDVVFCYRDPEGGESKLVRIEELSNYPELVARGPLGRLMTQGVIDQFVKHQKSAEEKQRQDEVWLDNLESELSY